MKFKFKTIRGMRCRELLVDGDKGDEINYIDAERLQRGDIESFALFSYQEKGKSYHFTYQIGDLIAMDEIVKTPFEPGQLAAFLSSFLRLIRDCEESGLTRQRVVLDPAFVFYDRFRFRMRFVYVPLQAFVSTSVGLNGTLAALCDQAQVPHEEEGMREAVLDYARRTAIITGIEFDRFLRGLGLASDASTTNSEQVIPSTSQWRSTDHLDDRTKHGFDFVSMQANRAKAPSPEAFWSVRIERAATSRRWRLDKGSYLIGRGDDCSLVLEDVRGMSRHHAMVTVSDSGCTVRDLNSTNGVFVNGCRITPQSETEVSCGDRLTLGDEEFDIL